MSSRRPSILVTGAGGKTGRAIRRRLVDRGARVVAFVRHGRQAREIEERGRESAVLGDLEDPRQVAEAMAGVDAVYHICPNVHPAETAIGETVVTAARRAGVGRFVFHSVLRPQVEAMPHHWAKMRVEELLFASGLEWTVLQPAAYMQNVAAAWSSITGEGVYPVPYAETTRVAMVDLEDVAEAAVQVLLEPGHRAAVYELCGPDLLDQAEIASALGDALGREVTARVVARSDWRERAISAGLGAYAVATLLAMFRYYERYGMAGNPRVLTWLLGRRPTAFQEFAARIAGDGSRPG